MGVLARQATWNAVLAYVGMGLGFVNVVLLYPRILPEDEFGLTRLVVSIATIAAQVAQLGLDNTVLRYFPYFRNNERQHNGVLGLVLALGTGGGLLAILVLWLFHGYFALWFGAPDGLYAAHGLTVLPLVLSEVYFFLFRSYSRSILRSIAPSFSREFILRVLQMVLIVAQSVWHFDLRTFMLLYTATFMVSTLSLVFDLWRSGNLQLGIGKLRLPDRLRRSMSRYAFFTFGSGMATIALGNVDQLMVGAMLKNGLDYVAYYAVAFYVASAILIPARALVLPSMPILAEAWKKKDHEKIAGVYHRSVGVQLITGGYLFLCICASTGFLFSLLPPGYELAQHSLLILGFTNLLILAGGLSGGILATSRSYWFDAMTGVVLVVLSVVLDYVFILLFGMVGAAWSSLTSFGVIMIWRVLFLKKQFGLWPFDGSTLVGWLMIGVTGVLVWLIPSSGVPLLDAVIGVLLITLVFVPTVHFLRLAPDLSEQVKTVYKRLRA